VRKRKKKRWEIEKVEDIKREKGSRGDKDRKKE
jgi:hypothetical protein